MKTGILKAVASSIIFLILPLQSSYGEFTPSTDSFQGQRSNDRLKVVSTTSLIGNIVKKIGGEKVQVVTIVPEGQCPGHFDIRPGDVKVLEEARLLLEHGFEGELFIEDMLNLVENKNLQRMILNENRNWMVPEIQLQAVDKIVDVLCRIKPECENIFLKNAGDYKRAVKNLARDIRLKAKELKVGKVTVASSEMQSEFVDWLGFNIAVIYGRPENFNPVMLKEMIEKGKSEEVKLVIDNLQSGAKAGIPLAEEIGCPHLVLTNFPLEYEGSVSYLKSLKENASKLFQAVVHLDLP